LQIGQSVAFSGKKVLFFSLEMDERQLWARMACPLAGFEWADVRAGNVAEEGLKRIEAKSAELRDKFGERFIIVDDRTKVHEMYRMAMTLDPDLVIIDQLDEIEWHVAGAKKHEWYGEAAKYLRRNIAKKLGVPVILIHQINRDTEDRQDKRPMISDLRWSGELEQRVDVLILLYREDLYTGRSPGQVDVPFEANIAKNRQGDAGVIARLNYNLKRQWFG
jgi:replicative DNA helicase